MVPTKRSSGDENEASSVENDCFWFVTFQNCVGQFISEKLYSFHDNRTKQGTCNGTVDKKCHFITKDRQKSLITFSMCEAL